MQNSIESTVIDDSFSSLEQPLIEPIDDSISDPLSMDGTGIFESHIDTHDTCSTSDNNGWGFMLNDEGGISTFDDSHGSVDWFDGDVGINDNCGGDF